MSGMEIAALGMMAAGTATQAYGHRMAGQEASRAATFEQEQLNIQAQTARTTADQAEAARREELTSNLETIRAIQAGRGVGGGPGTSSEAVLTSSIEDAERNIARERTNFLTKADLSRRAAELAGRKARTSLMAGNLQAAGDIFSAGTKAAGFYAYPTTRRA